MPDDAGERSEAPTPRRRQQARKKGQVARSQDLSATVILLAGLVTLEILGPRIWTKLLAVVRSALGEDVMLSGGSLAAFAARIALEMGKVFAPFLVALFVAAFVVMYIQVGWMFTLHPITPQLSRISPLAGIKRMFSARKLVEALMNSVKLVVVAGVAGLTVTGNAGAIIYAMGMDHVAIYAMLGELVFRLGIRLAIVMLVLALFDYAYQRYKHEKDLKMTKEEVKEELRNMEGDPVIRRRRREVQLQLAMQRLQSAVPQADVVVTNPTHYAVALKYVPETMNAPKVVAKGADFLALRLRQIAAGNGVPMVERKELARAMYAAVEVGEEIPEKFYQAVAEILAYVYELTNSGARPGGVRVA
jgi:flagellar biosynthetic protein FlhB